MKQQSLARNPGKLNQNQVEELIRQYVPLIRKVVSRIPDKICQGQDRVDIFEYGVMGLVKALDSYEYNDKEPFPEYAERQIREYIVQALRKETKAAKPKPVEFVNFNQFEEENLQNPEEPEEEEPHDCRVLEVLNFEGGDPLTALLNDENTRLIKIALNRLPQVQKECLRLSFYENLTSGEIAERLGLSEKQISDLRSEGLRRLRHHLMTHH